MPQIKVKGNVHMFLGALLHDYGNIQLVDIKLDKEVCPEGAIEIILEADFFPDHKIGAEIPELRLWLGPKRCLAPVGMKDWKPAANGWKLEGSPRDEALAQYLYSLPRHADVPCTEESRGEG